MRVGFPGLLGSCLLLSSMSSGACKSDAANSSAPENQKNYEATRGLATAAGDAPKAQPAQTPSPDGPVTVTRTHEVGQLYTLRMQRADDRMATTWIATAEILSASPTRIEMGIDVLSVSSQFAGKAPDTASVNTKVKVTIEGDSHDAEIISGGSDPRVDDLTALEMIAGDVCQPPTSSHAQSEEWVDGERTHRFDGVTNKDGTRFVSYAKTQDSEGFKSRCTATVSLDDGYAGEREQTNTLMLGKDLPPSVQTHTLTVRRL